jgi:glycosyltransferase involved in cell wall biosynthesis
MKNKLTICLIAYNHKNYIKEAIESVLNQKASFDWNIHIYDDSSTDGTTDILEHYKKKYPNKITLVVHEKNVGAAENWRQLLLSTESKYIAYIEGDDLWTDNLKIEKQCALLDKYDSVGLVYSQAVQIYEGKTDGLVIGKKLSRHGLFMGNPIPSSTVMMRRKCLDGFFDELGDRLKTWKMGDYPLWFWIAENWKLAFISNPMCAYRIVKNSATRSTAKRDWIHSKLIIQRYFFRKFASFESVPFYVVGTARLYAELVYHKLRTLNIILKN